MAGYKTHITVSGALGVGYGTAGAILGGFTPVEGALAGILTWFSGMLPDLDSASGRPVREVFSLLAAFAPFAMMGHLMEWTHYSYEAATLLAVIVYVTIRYGGQAVLNRTAVHRGMFHSIPGARQSASSRTSCWTRFIRWNGAACTCDSTSSPAARSSCLAFG
jgi:hypothetical protein